MRTYIKNHRRTQLRVESLEGKTLLSSGAVMQQVAHHVTAAPITSQAVSVFTGTLAGRYTSVHAPRFALIQSYSTYGTLSPVGSTHLYGTLFVRPSGPAGRHDGQLVMVNHGGSMVIDVYQRSTPGSYSYRVAHAYGRDSAFHGATGFLTITLAPSFTVPYYTAGHATMTFS
jgi:hypothetical protein